MSPEDTIQVLACKDSSEENHNHFRLEEYTYVRQVSFTW